MTETENKTCQNCHKEFTIEAEDFDFYKKIDVPAPTWCSECRFKRRLVFRNERKLFWNTDARNNKKLLSLYPPDSRKKIYPDSFWWSDEWDPMNYGKEYDPTHPFLEQVEELSRFVPVYARDVLTEVNSQYSANASELKNCYLLFNSNISEDCAYGNGVDRSRNCFDNSHIAKCERCYDSFWLVGCYQTDFSVDCEDCNNVWLSKNCRGCSNCVGCVNLRMKKYCVFNKQYTKEEYEKQLVGLKLDTYNGLIEARAQAKKFWNTFPNKYLNGTHNENVSGAYISYSKNVRGSYLIRESENLKYVQYSQVPFSKDVYDTTLTGNKAELMYENVVCGWGGYNVKFSYECWPDIRNIEYSMFCGSSSDLFGCVGLHKKQYCILNRQYTKEDYEKLKKRIIEDMEKAPYIDKQGRRYGYGEFFPMEISPFAYNQTIAPEHRPLTKGMALAQGFRWQDPDPREYKITMKASDLPQSTKEVLQTIFEEIIQCERCKRAYRLMPQEIEFLQKERIPLPHLCVDCRHTDRISSRIPNALYRRTCQCAGSHEANSKEQMVYQNTATHTHGDQPCPNEFETSYAPDRPEIVYCEQCYQSEIV